MAGRSTPGSFLSRIIDTAIKAPVFPQETTASASPARTASMADHIEVFLPLRITWLGLASIVTTSVTFRIWHLSARPLLSTSGSNSDSGPWIRKAMSEFFSITLENAGMTTRVVNDPPSSIQQLIEFQPDLVLMDVYMPECNGIELASVIRQEEAFLSIPIVLASLPL